MADQGDVVVRFNLFTLKQRLEIQKGEEISWAEMGRRMGLHHNTLHNLADNKTRRVDLETLERLLAFFGSEGMPVTISDLLLVERKQ